MHRKVEQNKAKTRSRKLTDPLKSIAFLTSDIKDCTHTVLHRGVHITSQEILAWNRVRFVSKSQRDIDLGRARILIISEEESGGGWIESSA